MEGRRLEAKATAMVAVISQQRKVMDMHQTLASEQKKYTGNRKVSGYRGDR